MKLAPTLFLVWLCGCAGRPAARTGPTGGLRLRCEPATATVSIDDRYEGRCALFARRPLALAPGRHRLQVDASGHYPHYAEVDVGRAVRDLDVRLVARPD